MKIHIPKTLHESQVSSERTKLSAKEQVKLVLQFQRYLLPFWDKVLLNFLMGLSAQYTIVIFPILQAKFIDEAIPQKDYAFYFGIVFVLGFFGFFLQPGIMSLFTRLTQGICDWYIHMSLNYKIRLMFYKHLHSLSMRFFQKRPVGEHMYRAQADCWGAIELVVQPIPRLLGLLGGQFVIIAVSIHFLPWYIIIAQYLYMLVSWGLTHWVNSIQRRMNHVIRERDQAVDATVMDGLAGAMTVKAFGRQRSEVRRFLKKTAHRIRQHYKIFWFNFLAGHINGGRVLGIQWFHAVTQASILGVLVILGTVKYGEQALIIALIANLSRPFQGFFDLFQHLRHLLIPAERLRDTLAVMPAVEEPRNGVTLKPLRGEITLENVSFEYENEKVLRGISVHIPAGTTVGIVGPSGAGKSTLLALFLRLYDPSEGRIFVDGHDLKTLRLSEYHHQIGPVLQETFMFQGTLRENMLFAQPHATDEDIMDALKRAEVADLVNQLPKGLDTDLSEGSRLSGGQKQRIGIARALLRNPSMMVLDEPTSSLDIPTEHAIVKTLQSVIENRTCIFVSHRLGLVSGCDMILVLEKGQLIAQGKHSDLLATCPLYHHLWTEQYGKRDAEPVLPREEEQAI